MDGPSSKQKYSVKIKSNAGSHTRQVKSSA